MKKLDENFVADQVKQLIEKLGLSATAEVSRLDKTFIIDIASADSSLLIGKYGANLESLQFILAVRIKIQTNEDDFEVVLDVDGWRKDREEKLQSQAATIAQEVAATGQAQTLEDLQAWQRRVIHLALADHPQVATESEGEGQDRRLVIKPR